MVIEGLMYTPVDHHGLFCALKFSMLCHWMNYLVIQWLSNVVCKGDTLGWFKMLILEPYSRPTESEPPGGRQVLKPGN